MSTKVAITLNLRGAACTDSALAFDDPEDEYDEPIWLPRSQIQNLEDVLDEFPDGIGWTTQGRVEIEIPTWLAEKKGLDVYAEELD